MSKQIKIAIAETSDVIRAGVISILKKMIPNLYFIEIKNMKDLKQSISHPDFDVLILNPMLTTFASPQQIKNENESFKIKIIALQSVLCENSHLLQYDETFSIYESADQIANKLKKTIASPKSENSSETLSSREKEIISLVVKGLSNKQIAEKLNLSIHTIISHRRNISTKLDIHSTSGLTIYAIVNKLIEIEEIGDSN